MNNFSIRLEKDQGRWIKGTLTVKGNVDFGTNFTFWIEGLTKETMFTTGVQGVEAFRDSTGVHGRPIMGPVTRTYWREILHEDLIPKLKQKIIRNPSKIKKRIREYSFSYHLPWHGNIGGGLIDRFYLRAKLIRRHMLDKHFKKRIKIKDKR